MGNKIKVVRAQHPIDQNVYSNPCTRCGKERIFVKTWIDKTSYSVVTVTEKACPDIKCQKIVDKNIKDKKNKYEASKLKRQISLGRNGKSRVSLKIAN